MLPEGSHKMIRSVNIHRYPGCVAGFSFLDKEGALLWKIGYTNDDSVFKETVVLEENEVIIGVVCKLINKGTKQA